MGLVFQMVTACKGKAISMSPLTFRKSAKAEGWTERSKVGWGPGVPGAAAWRASISRRPGRIYEKMGPDSAKKDETLFGRSRELSLLYQEKRV